MTTGPSDVPIAIVEDVCSLPVACLKTANFDLSVGDIIKDKNTIIDLWTTRCTRCPAALDTLNQFATSTTSIRCVSICCGDTLDGAREIIEATKLPRWGAIQHYFMAYQDKELCKQLLHFRQVPFYIVFHSSGTLLYSGNQKMDWQTLFQETTSESNSKGQMQIFDTKMTNIPDSLIHSPTSAAIFPTTQDKQPQDEETPAFAIDEMDF